MPAVRTDDELYRVNPIWLGPPNATMPFRARYVAWGVGCALFLTVFALARIWFPVSFFSLAWSGVLAVAVTRLVCSKITQERPLGAVVTMLVREIATPRRPRGRIGGAAASRTVRIRPQRPRPAHTTTPTQEDPRA